MTTSNATKIIITTVVSITIILTASFYRYTPNDMLQIMKKTRHEVHRMKITITNQNEPGSHKWVELRCKAFQDYDDEEVWWSGMALLQPGQKHNFTLPAISGTDIVYVLCKYKGSDGCTAEKVRIFQSPGTDNYYCGEGVGRCAIAFKSNGLVQKEYVGMMNWTLGSVPQINPGKKKCMWIDCLLRNKDLIIGEEQCCGSKCT